MYTQVPSSYMLVLFGFALSELLPVILASHRSDGSFMRSASLTSFSLLKVAKLTHAISIFTEGILMMKTTLVGIIKVMVLMLVSVASYNKPLRHLDFMSLSCGGTVIILCLSLSHIQCLIFILVTYEQRRRKHYYPYFS